MVSPAFRLLCLAFGCLACGGAGSRAATPSATSPTYEWQSPRGWRGGSFTIPPAFAPGLAFRGREVLRFSPGYYDQDASDFWTYAFVFLLERDADVTPVHVEAQLVEYFRGLGSGLGSHARSDLPASAIEVRRLVDHDDWHRVRVRAFDPWETGAPIDLNIEWSSRTCEGAAHRALLFKISPLDFDDAIWTQLESEASALHCR